MPPQAKKQQQQQQSAQRPESHYEVVDGEADQGAPPALPGRRAAPAAAEPSNGEASKTNQQKPFRHGAIDRQVAEERLASHSRHFPGQVCYLIRDKGNDEKILSAFKTDASGPAVVHFRVRSHDNPPDGMAVSLEAPGMAQPVKFASIDAMITALQQPGAERYIPIGPLAVPVRPPADSQGASTKSSSTRGSGQGASTKSASAHGAGQGPARQPSQQSSQPRQPHAQPGAQPPLQSSRPKQAAPEQEEYGKLWESGRSGRAAGQKDLVAVSIDEQEEYGKLWEAGRPKAGSRPLAAVEIDAPVVVAQPAPAAAPAPAAQPQPQPTAPQPAAPQPAAPQPVAPDADGDQLICEGPLNKLRGIGQTRKRWFRLTGKRLYFYSQDSVGRNKEEEKLVIQIVGLLLSK